MELSTVSNIIYVGQHLAKLLLIKRYTFMARRPQCSMALLLPRYLLLYREIVCWCDD